MTTAADSKLSPLWEKALENYREDLAADDDFRVILETGSLDELLKDTQYLQPLGSQGRKTLESVNRLKPTFKMVNDFSAALAVYFGAGTALTALIWGSIRMILSLASAAGNTLHEVFNMLDELSLTLPRLKSYEKTVPINPELEHLLLDIYTEVICFYARTIHFFKINRQVVMLRQAWSGFSQDFARTVQRIKKLSSTIESEVELTRMRFDNQKYDQVLTLMASFHTQQQTIAPKKSHYIPFTESPRFSGRKDILSQIDAFFADTSSGLSLRRFALYGIGGVGKTQIALRYANANRDNFDSILWVSADNLITTSQSFRDVANTLGLIQPNSKADDNSVILIVKDWLSSTDTKWLLVFDNVDDVHVLERFWPGGSSGFVLLTCRDSEVAFDLASDSYQVQPFDTAAGSEALLNILNMDKAIESNQEQASTISSTLGGLPLALGQIGGFIAHRRLRLQDFLPLYHRNCASVDSKRTTNMNYSHTLATVWDMSLSKLGGDDLVLLKVLAFLNPDYIRESLLIEGAVQVNHTLLDFAKDEIAFLDAEQLLFRMSLINISIDSRTLSMHRLVQKAVIRRMSPEERQEIFAILVAILTANLPDTYSADVGHQAASWERCERSLPHLESMVQRNKEFRILPGDNQPFAELLLRCCWYLYEKENYSIARPYVGIALQHFSDQKSLAYASAVDLQGLIDLDISRPQNALEAFEAAYNIRSEILPADDPFLAANCVNIGLAFTELAELDKAHEFLQKSIDIRLQHNSDRIGNSYSNMSSLLIRMGRPDNAEEMLKRCPSLKDFTDETFLKTRNPRFSGDMILLSRIRLAQGRYDESLNFSSKALGFRKECLGNRLKVCDSLYQVASLLQKGNKPALAIQLLEECIEISAALPPMEGLRHLARATHKLSQVQRNIGKERESAEYAGRALVFKREITNLEGESAHGITDFETLVPWMLW